MMTPAAPPPPTEPTPRDEVDAGVFAALGDPTRLHILRRLAAAPCCVGVLVDGCSALQPKVSRHLAVLRAAGLVTVQVQGKKRCYSLGRPALVRALLAALDLPEAS